MNKILSFVFAPVTALFLPQTLRNAMRSRGTTGLLYVIYGAFLFAALVTLYFSNRASISDEFFRWIRHEAPVLIWTPSGLSLENGQETAFLTHPIHGPIAIFDSNRIDVSENDMGRLYVFLTPTKIFFRKITGELDVRDVTRLNFPPSQAIPEKFRITGEMIEQFYQKGARTFLLATPIVVFLGVFIILLLCNLIISTIGLLVNMMRTHKLSYGAIFTLTCFCTGISLTGISIILFLPLQTYLVPAALAIGPIYVVASLLLSDK